MTSRLPVTTKSSSSAAASTSDRSNSMCGEIGVSSEATRARATTIGPRAENEYAVLPVGSRDDDAVGRVRGERGAVDRKVEADQVPGLCAFSSTASFSAYSHAQRRRSVVSATSSIMRSETEKSPASKRGNAGSSSSGSIAVR